MKINTIAVCAALVVLALFFAGCSQQQPPADNGTTDWFPTVNVTNGTTGHPAGTNASQNTSATPCSDSPNVLAKDACLLAIATSTQNGTFCTFIYTLDKKDQCLKNFEDGTPSYCQKYTSGALKDDCYQKIALANMTMAGCNLIVDSAKRAACLQLLVPSCDQLPSAADKAKCNAFKQSDPSLCPDTGCVYELAQNKSSQSICDYLNQTASAEACKSFASGNDVCSTDSNPVVADLCYQLWAQQAVNANLCSRARIDYGYRDKCLVNVSISSNDFTNCQGSSNEEQRNYCYSQFAQATGNILPCSNILSETSRNNCYNSAAFAAGMASFCNNISAYQWMSTCYSGVIQSGKRLSLDDCNNVSYQVWQERCWTTLAYQTQDRNICTLLSTPTDRQNCANQLG